MVSGSPVSPHASLWCVTPLLPGLYSHATRDGDASGSAVQLQRALLGHRRHCGRGRSLDDNQWRKGLQMLAHHSNAVRAAIAAKVPIVTGTDCPNGCAEVLRGCPRFEGHCRMRMLLGIAVRPCAVADRFPRGTSR